MSKAGPSPTAEPNALLPSGSPLDLAQAHPPRGRPRFFVERWRWLALILVLGLGLFAIDQLLRPKPQDRIRLEAHAAALTSTAPVLLVGDSIAFLAAPETLCGAAVFNAAVPGDRVQELVGDAPRYAARLSAKRVVIAVGVNDGWPRHRDIASWTDAYRRLVASYGARDLVLVEINPPDLSIDGVAHRLDLDFIAQANAAIRAIAAEAGAKLVRAPGSVQTRDSLHPSAAGIDKWRARLAQVACP